jgi:hypothetical protein
MKSDIKQIFGNISELKQTLYGNIISEDSSVLPLDTDAVMYYAKPKNSGEIVRSKNFLIVFSPCEKFEDNIEPDKSPFVDALETYNVDSIDETNISFSQSFLRFLSNEQLKDNALGQTEKWNFNEIDTDVLFIRDKETRWYTNTIKTLVEEQDQPVQDYTERMLEEFVTDVIFDELQNYPEIDGEKRQVALYGGHEGAGYGALRALLKIGEVLKNDQALGIDDTTKINYARIFNFTVYAYNFQTDILYEDQIKNAPIDEFVIRQLYPDLSSLPADGYKILRTEYENVSEEIRNLYDLSNGLDLYLSDSSLPLKLIVGGGHPVEGIENEAQSKFITLSEAEEWSNHLLYAQRQYTNGLADVVDAETGSVSWRFNVIYTENLKNNIIGQLSLRLMNQVPAEQGTLGGRVVDGYIANANGKLLSFTGNELDDDGTLETKEIATFTTDDAGRWSITLRKEEIPTTYKIEFQGGTDILTGEEYNGTLTSIGSLDIGSDGMQLSNENVNVSPISTIKSKLLEIISSGEKLKTKDWINLGDNETANTIIENAFGLTEEDVNSDYIFEQNPPALQANVKLNLVKNIVTSVFNENVDDDANKITHDDFISSYVKTIETGVTNNLELNENINETVSNLIGEVITNIESVTQISVDNIDLDHITELAQNLSLSAMGGMDDVSGVSVKAPANTFISNNFLISAKKMAKVNNYVTKLLGTETLKSSSIDALKDFGDEIESIKSEDVSIDDFTIVSIHGHAEKIIRITLDSREQNPWDPVFQIDDPNDDDDFLCYEYVFLTKHKDASFEKYDNNVWVGQIDQDLNLEYGSSFDDLPTANGTPIISKTRNKKIKLPRIMRGNKEYPAEIYAEDDYKLKCIPYVRRVTKDRYSKFVGFVPTDVYSNLYYSPITRFQGDDSETEQTSNFKEFDFTLLGGLSYGKLGISVVEIDKVKNNFIMQWSHKTYELINLNLKIQKWKFDFYRKNDEGTTYSEEPDFTEIVESANIKQETYSIPGGDYLKYSYKMDYMNQDLVVGEYKLVISVIDAYSENHRINASDSINANYETMSEAAVKIVAKSRIDEVWDAYQDPNNIGVAETANLNGKLRFAENNPNGNVYGSFEIQTPLHEQFNSIEYSIRTINTKNDGNWTRDYINDNWNYLELEQDKTKANITREDLINYLSDQGINAEVDIGIFNYEFELPAISNEIYLESNSTEKSDAIYYYVLESFVKMGPSDSVTTILEEGDLIDASGMLAYDFRNLPDLKFQFVRYNSENDKYEIQLNANSYVFELDNEASYNEPNNLSKDVLYKHPRPNTGYLSTGRVDEFSISINNEEYISIKPSLTGIFTIETIPTLAPTYIKLKYSSSNPYISDKTLVLNIDIDVSNIKFGKVKSSVNEEANYYSAHNYSEVGENETGLYLEWDDVTLKHKPFANNSKIHGFSDYNPILKYRIQFNDDEPFVVSSNKLNISEYLAEKTNIVGEHEIKVNATDDSNSETQQFSYNLKIDSDETQTSSVVFGKGLGLDPLPTETGDDFEFQWHFKDGDYTINNSNRLKHYELYLNGEKLTRIKNMADPEKSKNQGRYVYKDFELDYFDKNTINTYLLQVDESKDYTLTVVGVLHSGLKTEPVSHTVVAFIEPPETPSDLIVPQLEVSDFTNSSDGKIPFGTLPSISWTEHDNTNVNLPNVTHYSISLGSYSFESESIDFEGYNTGTLSFDFDKIEPSSDKPILDANGTYAISIVAINELMVESEPAILNFDVYYTDDQLAEIESTTRTLIPDDGLSEELVSIRDGFFPSSIEIPTPKKYPNVQAHDFPGDMTMLVTMEDPFGNISNKSNTLPTKSYIENSGEYDSHPRYYRLLTYNGNPSDPKWNISISESDSVYSQGGYHGKTRVYPDTKFLLGDLNAKFVVSARARPISELKTAVKLNKLSNWRNDYLLSFKIDTYVNENGDLKYKNTSENDSVGDVGGYLKEFLNNDFDSPNVLDDFYLDFSLDLVTIDSNNQSFSIVIGEPGSNGSFLRVHEKIFNKHDAKLGNGEYTTEKATTKYNGNFPVGMPRSFDYSEIEEKTTNSSKSPVVTNNKFKSAVKSAISRNYKDFICVAKYANRALVITLADESVPKGGFKIFQRNSSSTTSVSEPTIQVDDSLIGGEKVGVVVSQSGDSTKVILGARSFIKGVDSQSMNDLYTTSPSFENNSLVPHNRRIDSTFSDINESGYTEKKEWVLHRNNVVKYYKIYAKTQITDDWYLIKEGSFDEIIQSTELKRFPSFRDKSYSSKWEFDFSEDYKLKIINKRKPNKYSYQEMIMVKEYTDDSLNHRKIIKFCSSDFHNLTLSDEQITYREIEGYSPIAKVYTRASGTYDDITWGSLTTTDSSMGVKAIFDPKNTHPRDEKTPPKICARKIVSSNSGNTIAISIHTDELIDRYNREDIAYLKVFVKDGVGGYKQKGQGISYLDCNEHGDFDISGDGNILVVSANKLTTQDCVKVFNYDPGSNEWILNAQNKISMDRADKNVYSATAKFTDLDGVSRKSHLFGSEVSISKNGNIITVNAPGARRMWINSRCNISGGVFVYEYKASLTKYKKIPTPFSSFLNAFKYTINKNYNEYIETMEERIVQLGITDQLSKSQEVSLFNIAETYLGLNLGGVIKWQDSDKIFNEMGPKGPTPAWYYETPSLSTLTSYGYASNIPVKPNDFIKTLAPLEAVSFADPDNSQILPKNQYYRVKSIFDSADPLILYAVADETQEIDFADLSYLFVLISVVINATEEDFLIKRTDRVDKWELVLPTSDINSYVDDVPPFEPIFKSNLINYTTNKTPTWQWNPVNKKVNNTDIVQTLLEDGASYNYYLDDNSDPASLETTTNLEFTPLDVLGVGTHTLYLSAKDAVNNESGQVTYDIQVVDVNNLIVDGIKYFGTDDPVTTEAYGVDWYVSPSNLLDITWNKLADDIANAYKTIYYRVVLYKLEEFTLDETLVFESQLFTDNNFTMHYKVPMDYYKIGVGVVAVDENDNTLNSDYVYFMVKTNEQSLPHIRSCLPFNLEVKDSSESVTFNEVSVRKHNGSIIAKHPTDNVNPHPWYFHKPIYYASVANDINKQVNSLKITLGIAEEWFRANQITESNSVVFVGIHKVSHGTIPSGYEEDKYHGVFASSTSARSTNDGDDSFDGSVIEGFTTGKNASEYLTDGIAYFNGRDRSPELNYISTQDYDPEKNYKYPLTHKIRFVDVDVPNNGLLDEGIYEIRVKVANREGETYDYPIGDLSNTYFYDQSSKEQVSNYANLYSEAFDNATAVDFDVTRLVLKNTTKTESDIQIKVNSNDLSSFAEDLVTAERNTDIKIEWTDLEPSIDSRADSLLYPFTYKVRFTHDELESALSTTSILRKYQNSLKINSYYTTNNDTTQTNYTSDLLNYEYILPGDFLKETLTATVDTIGVHIDVYHFNAKIGTREFGIHIDSNSVELVEHPQHSSENGILYNQDYNLVMKWAYSLEISDKNIFQSYSLRVLRRESTDKMYWYYSDELKERVWGYSTQEIIHQETRSIGQNLNYMHNPPIDVVTDFYDEFEYTDSDVPNINKNYIYSLEILVDTTTGSDTGHIYEFTSSHEKESTRALTDLTLSYNAETQILNLGLGDGDTNLSLYDKNKINRNLVELFSITGSGEDLTSEKIGEKTFLYDPETGNQSRIDLKNHFTLEIGTIEIKVTSYLLDNDVRNHIRTASYQFYNEIENKGFVVSNIKQKYNSKINLRAYDTLYPKTTYDKESFYESAWKKTSEWDRWTGIRKSTIDRINNNEKPDWVCVDPNMLDTTESNAKFSFTWDALTETVDSYTIKLRTYKFTHEFEDVLGKRETYQRLYWGEYQPGDGRWTQKYSIAPDTSMLRANFSQISNYEKKLVKIEEFTVEGDQTEFEIPTDYINSVLTTHENTNLFKGDYSVRPHVLNDLHKKQLKSRYHWGFVSELEIVAKRSSDEYTTSPVFSESFMLGDVKTKIKVVDSVFVDVNGTVKIAVDFIKHPFYYRNNSLEIINKYKIVPVAADPDSVAWESWHDNKFGHHTITKTFTEMGFFTLLINSTDNLGNVTEAQVEISVIDKIYFDNLDVTDYSEPKKIPKYRGLLSKKYNEYAFAFIGIDEISKRVNRSITHHPGKSELEQYTKSNTTDSYEYKMGDFIRFNSDYKFELPEHVGAHEQVFNQFGLWEVDYMDEWHGVMNSPIEYSKYRTNGILPDRLEYANLPFGYRQKIYATNDTGYKNYHKKNLVENKMKENGAVPGATIIDKTKPYYVVHDFQVNSPQDVSSHDTTKKYGVVYGVNKTDTETELYVFLNGGYQTTLFPPEKGTPLETTPGNKIDYRSQARNELEYGGYGHQIGGCIKIKINDVDTGSASGLWDVVSPITTDDSLEASGLYKDEYATYDDWEQGDLIKLNNDTQLKEVDMDDSGEQIQLVELEDTITMQANKLIGLQFDIAEKFLYRFYSPESADFKLYALPNDVQATRWVSDPNRIVIEPGYPKHPQIIVNNIDNFTSSSNVYPSWKYSHDTSPGGDFEGKTYYERHLYKKNGSDWIDITESQNVDINISGYSDSDDILLFKTGNDDNTNQQIALQNGTYKFTIQTMFKHNSDVLLDRKSTIAESRELTINLDPPGNVYSLQLTEQGGYEYTPGTDVEIYSGSGEYASQIEANKVKWKWNLYGFTSADGHYEVTLKEYIRNNDATDGSGEFVEILKQEVNATQFAYDYVKIDSIYRIEVVAVNLQGISSTTPTSSTIKLTDLTPPNSVSNIKFDTPTFPVSFAVEQFFNDMPTWSWDAVEDAYEYKIDLEVADAKYDVSELHIKHTNNQYWNKEEDGTYTDPSGNPVDFTDTTYIDADGNEWPEPYNIPTIEIGTWGPSLDEELMYLRNVKTNSFTPPKSLPRGKFWRIKVTAIDSYGNLSSAITSASYHLPYDTDKDNVADFYDYWKSDSDTSHTVAYLESLVPNVGLEPRVGNLVRFIGETYWGITNEEEEEYLPYSTDGNVWYDTYSNPYMNNLKNNSVRIYPNTGNYQSEGSMPTYAIVTWVNAKKTGFKMQYGPYTLWSNVANKGPVVDDQGIITGDYVFVTAEGYKVPQKPTDLSHNEEDDVTINKKPRFSWKSVDADTFILKVNDEILDDPIITKTSENNFEFTHSEDLLGSKIKFSVIARLNEFDTESEEVSVILTILEDTDGDGAADGDDYDYFKYDADDQRTIDDLKLLQRHTTKVPEVGDIVKIFEETRAFDRATVNKKSAFTAEVDTFYKITEIEKDDKTNQIVRVLWYEYEGDINTYTRRFFPYSHRKSGKWDIVSDEVPEITSASTIIDGAVGGVPVVEYIDDPDGTAKPGSVIKVNLQRNRPFVPTNQKGPNAVRRDFKQGEYYRIKRQLNKNAWLVTIGATVGENETTYSWPKSWVNGTISTLQKIKE